MRFTGLISKFKQSKRKISILYNAPNYIKCPICGDLFPVPPKTETEFMHLITTFSPYATAGQDNDGQLIVYTNLKVLSNHSLIDYDGEFVDGE